MTAEPAQAGLRLTCTCGRTVQVPSWQRPLDAAEDPPPRRGRSRLTALGWTFLLLAAATVVATSLATDALEMAPGSGRKFVRVVMGVGGLVVVGAVAALLRALGARFYRDD